MAQNQNQKSPGRAANSLQIRRMAVTGMLFAVVLVLSAVENQVQIPVPAPGVKLGLSNIAVMYALFFVGKKEALLLAVLKSVFVFVTRGAVASLLSLCGGVSSVAVMVLCVFLFKERISYLMVSVVGAIFHNIGQTAAVSAIYTNLTLWAFLPVLLISAILAGAATSVLLKVTLPALKKLELHP